MRHLSGRPLLDVGGDVELFAGRDADLRRLAAAVDDGLNTLVLGERGAGKTSLLRRLAYDLLARHVPHRFVDGAVPTDAASLLHLIAYRIAGVRSDPIGLYPAAGPEATLAPDRLLRAIDALADAVGDRHVILLLDGMPEAGAPHTLFGRLRDELWQLPLTWVVAADLDRRAEYRRPPADAFFDQTLVLAPLSPSAARGLLEARLFPGDLSGEQTERVIDAGSGNPRRILALARAAMRGDGLEGRPEVDRKVAELGRPAAMLVSELEAAGGMSASDDRLLRRLGWTRSRAVQVFRQLEEAGLVTASFVRSRHSGRPRKVYELAEPALR